MRSSPSEARRRGSGADGGGGGLAVPGLAVWNRGILRGNPAWRQGRRADSWRRSLIRGPDAAAAVALLGRLARGTATGLGLACLIGDLGCGSWDVGAAGWDSPGQRGLKFVEFY